MKRAGIITIILLALLLGGCTPSGPGIGQVMDGDGMARSLLEIVWPEKVSIPMEDHDSFFLRDGEKLFFNRWHEEGEGAEYRYWEETIVRDLAGEVIETLPGDVMLMPNGEIWNLADTSIVQEYKIVGNRKK